MTDGSSLGSPPQRFELDRWGMWVAIRAIPGVIAILLLHLDRPFFSAACLGLCSLGDLLVDSAAERAGWRRSASSTQVEGFVDFLCFVWAPAELVLRVSLSSLTLVAVPVFVAAGAFRLARFNVEGVSGGRYTGLPVTYNGVLVPPAVGIAAWAGAPADVPLFVFLVGISLAMASRTLSIRRISV